MNKPLIADTLRNDPRIAQAKALIQDAVQSIQKGITGIRPPNPALKVNYDTLLASFAECRGSKLWYPYLGSGIGNGCLVELLDGSIKYDLICGIGPHYLGHSHPALVVSSIDAAISDTIMQGHLQQNVDTVELSAHLIKLSGMDHCFLTSSGAMANENALKIAFQCRYPAHRILAFEHCFAGRTLALSQITDKPAFREGLPDTIMVDYIPFFNATSPKESTENAVAVLKQHLARHPKQYAAMIFELIQGESGFYPGSHEFFRALMEILKEHHISIIADEVQTFGRTPALFAFQHFGLSDYVDVVTIGKLSQVCATLFKKDHRPRAGLLSQTFTGSTSAIRASRVILDHLMQGGYFGENGKIMQIHAHFARNLNAIAQRHPNLIHGPFGFGAMIAFTPFDGDLQKSTKFAHDLFEAGVISFIAGTNPTRIRFLVPAGTITSHDIDAVTKIVEETLMKNGEERQD